MIHVMSEKLLYKFFHRSLNVHSAFGPVVNPFQSDSDRVPWREREKRSAGGSSGGSAAAVASKQCFA